MPNIYFGKKMSCNLHHILPYTSPPQFRPFTNWIMAWPFYCDSSLKFFKMCVMHHQQTTYASIWNTVDEFWLLLHPTQCFQLFRERRWCFVRQLGDRLARLPHSWTEKLYVRWTEERVRENLAQQCLLTVRTTDETDRGLIGPACLL